MSAKTQHQRYRLHSQLNNSVIRNYAKMRAREPMLINVNEGIATGNVVRVFNDRGEILVGTLATHHPKARHRHLQRHMVRP
ncbi:hypothetical protein [Campylobacter concisus]|uniref:hypothetical protein n=1 Tax=Campylobacter concisus TaxID=199 RepID=UPI0021563F6E|nr:hypothetical protein [Campylobacter concisus]